MTGLPLARDNLKVTSKTQYPRTSVPTLSESCSACRAGGRQPAETMHRILQISSRGFGARSALRRARVTIGAGRNSRYHAPMARVQPCPVDLDSMQAHRSTARPLTTLIRQRHRADIQGLYRRRYFLFTRTLKRRTAFGPDGLRRLKAALWRPAMAI